MGWILHNSSQQHAITQYTRSAMYVYLPITRAVPSSKNLGGQITCKCAVETQNY